MTKEILEFKTEVNQLLDLMIHSLYSHKEVFLRELISNASDAIDKARYESLTNADIQKDGGEWKIKLSIDKAAGTLTISDNGIGMNKEEGIRELGTIARSGTMEFLAKLKEKSPDDSTEMIGQFGVGFYSSFMVADRVVLISKKAGTNDCVRWESTADGTFTVEDTEKATRGTDVILYIKEEEKEKYLTEYELRRIVTKYSDYIDYPVVMDVERQKESEIDKGKKYTVTEEEKLNSQKAIWLRDKSEITESEYNEFYKHVAHDFTDPTKVIHYKAEGTTEFTALLFIPSRMPFDIFYKDFKYGPMLYVRRVQIMEHCEELIPQYLRFVKGVVDSSDLPLNVSREILQNNRQIEVINKNLTKKVSDSLSDMKQNEFDKYLGFYKQFGRILKEGIHFSYEKRETVADLLLFSSTATETGKYTTLKDYTANMKEDQKDIYYMTATDFEDAIHSPYLETFKEKGYEVLILLDEIDDMIFTGFQYGDKDFKSALRGDITLDKAKEEEKKESEKKYKKLLDLISTRLKGDVKEARFSGRLKDSPCCLVGDEGAMDANMERLFRSMGKDVPNTKKIFELNPTHPLIEAMNELFEHDQKSEKLPKYIDMLYNQALVLEGSRPKDSQLFASMVSELMVKDMKST
ncbi:molecular chaperone HtpG [Candidatus Magnetomonas plexicatena]|uniref:molecular chaperone HtpG n=1 Tax=Candidatus Magnetomonas plexicatena TaxID=2552947 RepID=UPI001C78B099|nr:molecular chaperone HtpG [Nitrospirales bacterium LBB_01]